MSWIEIVGTVFGLACVWLSARENIWSWPVGLVNISLFTVMFARARLYPEVITHSVFFVMSVWGWWGWLRGVPRHERLVVRRLPRRGWIGVVALVAGVGLLMGEGFARWTDAAFPHLDSMITVASLVAQALLARKILENWLIWIAIDVVAIGIYMTRGLYLTSGLYLVYMGLSFSGWRTWKRRV